MPRHRDLTPAVPPAVPLGLLLVLVSVLAACAAQPPLVGSPAGERWVVGIAAPRGDWWPCFEDDAVAETLMTADEPTSSASATFVEAATRADVDRVVSCLDVALTSGSVTITPPDD